MARKRKTNAYMDTRKLTKVSINSLALLISLSFSNVYAAVQG